MIKNVVRLIFVCSLSLAVGLASAQKGGGGSHSSGSSSSRGGSSSHFGSGTSGYGSYRSSSPSRYGSGFSGGGYSRYSGSYRSSASSPAGSTSSRYSGGSRYSRSGAGSTTSRYQSRSGDSSSSRQSSGVYHRSNSGSATVSTGSNGGFERGHASESRSGAVNYSGNNNRSVGGRVAANEERIGSAPRGLLGQGAVGRVIGNGGGFGRGGFRTGYFGYGPFWRDSFFCFPFYCFDPWLLGCYCSPWYCYPCLPPYVLAPNVIIEDNYPYENWSGSQYDWAPQSNASTNPVLDDSVEDLVQSFEGDDHKAIDRVTPHSGDVKILADGKYNYSLKANDFYDTYVDGIESTKTDRYQIVDVEASKDGASARVVAKHIYNDPQGNRTSVYHSYLMVKEGGEYVIRQFGTSNNNPVG